MNAHSNADLELLNHWPHFNKRDLGREPTALDRAYGVHWLNVFGREMVDALGRERVLSTPAHLVEELPSGAVLIVTHPTVADFASDARTRRGRLPGRGAGHPARRPLGAQAEPRRSAGRGG